MGEQIIYRDPKTGAVIPAPTADARQNTNYVPSNDPQLTARDFSRPHTIPQDEYEAGTGRNWAKDCATWDTEQPGYVAPAPVAVAVADPIIDPPPPAA